MTKYYCDKCGAEIRNPKYVLKVRMGEGVSGGTYEKIKEDFVLCDLCFISIGNDVKRRNLK